MAIRSSKNSSNSRPERPAPEPHVNPPKYIDGQIVRDDDDVRSHRVQSRKEFTDAIQSKGGEGRTYGAATNKLYGKVFRDGTPMGKPDDWNEEEQKRITVAQKVAKQYVDEGDDGHYGIISSVERGGSDANGRCNEDGTESWWRKLVGYDHQEQAAREEKKTVVERRQTDDDEDDSHLTEGGRMLRASRKRAAEAEAKESGGFLRACFGSGKDIWEEAAERQDAEIAAADLDAESSSSSSSEDEESSGGGFLHWFFNP